MFGIDDALIGAGLSAVGGLIGNQMSSRSAASAQDFSAQQYATRYQTQVADMKAAGLNPMLAYQQSPGSSPQGVTYKADNPFRDVGSAYQSFKGAPAAAARDYASAGQARSQEGLNEANTKVAQATLSKVEQEISYSKTDQERVQAVTRNLAEEFQNIMKQGWNLMEVGNQLRASVSLMRSQAENQQMQAALAGAETFFKQQLKLSEEHRTELLRIDKDAASSFGELGKTVGALEPFLKLVWAAFRR
nr:MAG: DNA pilot protein [Microvirus sp.]